MPKNESSDIYTLIISLQSFEVKALTKHLEKSNIADKDLLGSIFNFIRSRKNISNSALRSKFDLTSGELTKAKHKLFSLILKCLKTVKAKSSTEDVLDLMLEFDILINHGIFNKAHKKLARLIAIGNVRCDYDLCIWATKNAIKQGLFYHESFTYNHVLENAYKQIVIFEEKANELRSFELLSDQVLLLHYEFLDKRLDNRNEILDYLKHPLLSQNYNYKCELSEFFYYRIKSIIFLGDNDHKRSRDYSLKAIKYLQTIENDDRDDFLYKLKSLNNYLDASLHLEDIDSYLRMKVQLDNHIASNIDSLSLPFKGLAFQFKLALDLNYLWLRKDYSCFLDNRQDFFEKYLACAEFLRPNIDAEILFGFSRLFFIAGDYENAQHYCQQLIDTQKKNPTTLILCCCNILRVLINFELGNLKAISHIIKSSKYFLKTRNRYFKIENVFFSGLSKIKPYNTEDENTRILRSLHKSLDECKLHSQDHIIDNMLDLTEWLSRKTS